MIKGVGTAARQINQHPVNTIIGTLCSEKMAESKRKSITLKDKLAIVKGIETGEKNQAEICREKGLSRSTVATIWGNRLKLKNSIEDGETGSLRKRMHGAKNEDLDNAVYHWFVQVRERKLPVSTHILKEKAKTFATAFGIEDFYCSNGWIDCFKQWHDLKFRTISGKKWKKVLRRPATDSRMSFPN